jgi:hypothetical protein
MFFVTLFLVLAVAVPIAIGAVLSMSRGWAESWRTADWSSSHLLPEAAAKPEAKVVILAARTGRWKSIFAEHLAIVLKTEGASHWTRYEVVGWGNPVRRNAYAADAFWYGNRPYVAAAISGPQAAALIPLIEQSIARYPHRQAGSYTVWPGPNSNSFVAWVVRNTPGFDVELPPAAVGKDYLGRGIGFDRAPSGSGFTVSAAGLLGLTIALGEGVELNLLGTTIGIDPNDLAIKLPSLGKLSLLDLVQWPISRAAAVP